MQYKRLLELAIKGLEAERARIELELSELEQQASVNHLGRSRRSTATKTRPRRVMSAAVRKKISEAMKRKHQARRIAARS